MSSNSKNKKQKNMLLARTSVNPPLPSETTRRLTAILDGKVRPTKRAKKSNQNAPAAPAPQHQQLMSSDRAQGSIPWSCIASLPKAPVVTFGSQKGLDMLPLFANVKGKNQSTTTKSTKQIPNTINGTEKENNKKKRKKSTKKQKDTETSLITEKGTVASLKEAKRTDAVSVTVSSIDTNNKERSFSALTKEQQSGNGEAQSRNYNPRSSNPREFRKPISIDDKDSKSVLSHQADSPIQSTLEKRQLKFGNDSVDLLPHAAKETEQAILSADGAESTWKVGLHLNSQAIMQRKKRCRSWKPSTCTTQKPNTEESRDSEKDLAVLGTMLSLNPESSKKLEEGIGLEQKSKRKQGCESTTNQSTRLLPAMKPLLPDNLAEKRKLASAEGSHGLSRTKQRTNDNFVRLNLRNSAGACRGARNKKKRSKKFDRFRKHNYKRTDSDWDSDEKGDSITEKKTLQPRGAVQRSETFRAGVDPLDDYLDGVFKEPPGGKTLSTRGRDRITAKSVDPSKQPKAPICTRHQRPCKLLTVKKTSTGNKGRTFYACSMPRGEQCDHFQWADDTLEAAKVALLKNTSHSGFMARQVAAYSERFKKLTVPELRESCKKRNLDASGKKQQLLMRLSIWVRDELATVAPHGRDGDEVDSEENNCPTESKDSSSGLAPNTNSSLVSPSRRYVRVDEEEDCSSSEEELEFFVGDQATRDSSRKRRVAWSMSCASSKREEETNIGQRGTRRFSKRESTQTIVAAADAAPSQDEDTSSEGSELEDGDSQDDDDELKGEKIAPSFSATSWGKQASFDPANPIKTTVFSLFGYRDLREGQEWAIQRCLDKQKTLLVAPTGFGKSMCYVIPAALMDGVCIVVSPLISLIQDQLRELPPRIPAATLSGSLTTAATAAIVDDVIRKRIKVLFVSPERLASASFQRLFQLKWNEDSKSMERPFPQVSLLCVDEAHCLSQWGHNFRPSYLRLRSLLNKIEPQSVLAITATAGRQVVNDICQTLAIQRCEAAVSGVKDSCKTTNCPCGVWTMNSDRDNINVTSYIAKSQELRLSALVNLLKSSYPAGSQIKEKTEHGCFNGSLARGSVIVYVWRQTDAEVVAESLQASGVSGGVVFYHGGMDSGSRANAYSKFMRGKARICVATVAFGLGVNKPDIVGVVHMYLPASPEHYLQETGRAGRDGRAAQAIALVVEQEALVRHSHAYADYVVTSQVLSVLEFFRDLAQKNINLLCCDHWSQVPALGLAVPLDEIALASDCKPETIETIFSILELQEGSETPSVQVEGTSIDQVTISLKRRTLTKLAENEAIAKCILSCGVCVDRPAGEEKTPENTYIEQERENSRHQQFAAYSFGSHRFSVTLCANVLGPSAQPRHVFAALRRLQTNGEIELNFDKTSSARALRVILNKQGLQMFLAGESNNSTGLQEVAASLAGCLASIARVSANKALDIHYILHQISKVDEAAASDYRKETGSTKSASLELFQKLARQYFACGENERLCGETQADLPEFVNEVSDKEILIDVFAVITDLTQGHLGGIHKSKNALKVNDPCNDDYTALAITKFFHGIATVRTPLSTYRRHRFFGKWQSIRFDKLLETVQRVLSHAQQ